MDHKFQWFLQIPYHSTLFHHWRFMLKYSKNKLCLVLQNLCIFIKMKNVIFICPFISLKFITWLIAILDRAEQLFFSLII
ncbi:MAG: hypothetical protein BGP15_00340 [Sphingobacterium sp. 40-24]|nr:MAG: hypothetical protein BGP15_00340 [Sphingobacterium sp. 40-24]